MKIFGVGDLHARWDPINQLIINEAPDIILQVGDYGWWPHYHGKTGLIGSIIFDQYGLINKQNGKTTKIFWCPGNHENWDELDKLGHDIIEVQEGIFYCPFGTLIELPEPDNRTVMFCGGALSIDYMQRTEGKSWWKQEIILQEEMDRLPETTVDIIVSHTVPRNWISLNKNLYDGYLDDSVNAKIRDSSTFALQLIYEKYQPSRWISGHFHNFADEKIKDCHWTSLGRCDRDDQWWIKL